MGKQFLFRISPGRSACLICNEPIAVNKKSTISSVIMNQNTKCFLPKLLITKTTSTVSDKFDVLRGRLLGYHNDFHFIP